MSVAIYEMWSNKVRTIDNLPMLWALKAQVQRTRLTSSDAASLNIEIAHQERLILSKKFQPNVKPWYMRLFARS